MQDRELLRLAGVASGETAVSRGVWKEHDPRDGYHFYDEGFGVIGSGKIEWNPLRRDEDAFRLAVKLRLLVQPPVIDTARVVGNIEPAVVCGDEQTLSRVVSDGDHYAATRRAIVVAASRIGQSLEG